MKSIFFIFYFETQERDDYSVARQTRAESLPRKSKDDFLSILGDTEHEKYPIYMDGTYKVKLQA